MYEYCTPRKREHRGETKGLPQKENEQPKKWSTTKKHQTRLGRKLGDQKLNIMNVSITNLATALKVESLHKKAGITREIIVHS